MRRCGAFSRTREQVALLGRAPAPVSVLHRIERRLDGARFLAGLVADGTIIVARLDEFDPEIGLAQRDGPVPALPLTLGLVIVQPRENLAQPRRDLDLAHGISMVERGQDLVAEAAVVTGGTRRGDDVLRGTVEAVNFCGGCHVRRSRIGHPWWRMGGA